MLRREVLTGLTSVTTLTACGNSILFQQEPQRTPENLNRGPERGDVVSYHGIPCLLRSNVGMKISNLPLYLRNSKAKEYGRKFWDNLPDYVLEDIIDRFPPQSVNVQEIIDRFSGQFRRKKPNGGEMMGYFGGMWTSRGFPLDGTVNLDKDPFVEIRKKLTGLNWQLFDSNFFTYDAVGLKEYKVRDTLKPVDQNIRSAIFFFDILKNDFPFVQFNIVAHSLGGIFALEAVKRHMDIVNSLTLIDVPFGGLDTSADEVKKALNDIKISLQDNPVTYLDRVKRDENYSRDLDKFGEEFTGKKRKLTVIRSKNDPITKDSQKVNGAKLVVLEGGGHGDALGDGLVHDVIAETVGRNLAA